MTVAGPIAQQAHVTAAQGALGQRYQQAMSEYRQMHFRTALPLFQQVAASDRHDPYASQYVTETQTAIDAGQDRTPATPGLLPAVGVGLYVVASAVVLVIGILVWRRRRQRLRGW